MHLSSRRIAFAFLLFGLVPALAPGLALAAESDTADLAPIADDVSTIVGRQELMELDLYTLGDEVSGLRQDMQTDSDLQLQELRGLREDVASGALTEEDRDMLRSIDASLRAMGESESETEETESEPEPEPYIDIEGIAQLLMLNVGCNAVMIGLQAFGRLWETLAGMK